MGVRHTDYSEGLARLKPKAKEPNSRGVLDSWIAKAEIELNDWGSGRLSWIISTTICAAKLQSVLDSQGRSCFALKGGTLLQHKLGLSARATKDLDGMVRGDIEGFIRALDEVLSENWGPISFQRSEVELVQTPSKIVKPRRFYLFLAIKGQTWRKVEIEISPSEGLASETFDTFPAPRLSAFGLPSPDYLVSIAMAYQIAQKIHAVTDPHNPPLFINRRARDVVDLLLLKDFVSDAGGPSDKEIGKAIKDVFLARMQEARALGRPERTLPARIVSYPHWESDYKEAARQSAVSVPMEDAICIVNEWIEHLSSDDSL